jgi:hypothetical protein
MQSIKASGSKWLPSRGEVVKKSDLAAEAQLTGFYNDV